MNRRLLLCCAVASTVACAKGDEPPALVPSFETSIAVDAGETSREDAAPDVASEADPDGSSLDATLDVEPEVAVDAGGDAPIDALDAKPDVADASDSKLDVLVDAAPEVATDAGKVGSVLLLGCNGGSLGQARFVPGTGWSSLASAGLSCSAPPAIARATDTAVAVVRRSDGAVYTATYGTTAWGTFAAAPFGGTTPARPALTPTATGAYLVFTDSTGKHVGSPFDGAKFASPVEPLTGAFGSFPPTVAASGSTLVATYRGADKALYVHTRIAGAWTAATKVADLLSSTALPQIVATEASPDFEIIYAGEDDKLYVTGRSGGTFTAPVAVAPAGTDATTKLPFSVTRSKGGAIVLAFVGTDGKPYWMQQVTPGGSFSSAALLDTATGVSAVVLTNGVSGADAEAIVATGTTGTVRHLRFSSTFWTTAVTVPGGALDAPALTTLP